MHRGREGAGGTDGGRAGTGAVCAGGFAMVAVAYNGEAAAARGHVLDLTLAPQQAPPLSGLRSVVLTRRAPVPRAAHGALPSRL